MKKTGLLFLIKIQGISSLNYDSWFNKVLRITKCMKKYQLLYKDMIAGTNFIV